MNIDKELCDYCLEYRNDVNNHVLDVFLNELIVNLCDSCYDYLEDVRRLNNY